MEAIHFPDDGLRRDTTVRLAYRGSKGSCLYADARSPLRNAQSIPELWARLAIWAMWSHVGRVIGVITEVGAKIDLIV